MSSQGYISLHRKLIDNHLWTAEPFTRGQAWVDLILLANHKDGSFFVRGNLVEVKRGFIAASEDTLAKKWKWSRGKVRRFLKLLETEQQIVQHKSKVLSQIQIVNYDEYQQCSTTGGTTDGRQTVQQTDTNNNVNNVNNVNKEKIYKKESVEDEGDKNSNKSSSRGNRLWQEFPECQTAEQFYNQLPDKWFNRATEEGATEEDVRVQSRKFWNNYVGKGETRAEKNKINAKRPTSKNWFQSWGTWIDNARDWGNLNQRSKAGSRPSITDIDLINGNSDGFRN